MTIYRGTVGLILDINAGTDISGGSNPIVKLRVVRPDGQIATWSPTVINAVTGSLEYNTINTDLNMSGHYIIQATYQPHGISNDIIYYGESATLDIKDLPR